MSAKASLGVILKVQHLKAAKKKLKRLNQLRRETLDWFLEICRLHHLWSKLTIGLVLWYVSCETVSLYMTPTYR